jgi:hypothetical protein
MRFSTKRTRRDKEWEEVSKVRSNVLDADFWQVTISDTRRN